MKKQVICFLSFFTLLYPWADSGVKSQNPEINIAGKISSGSCSEIDFEYLLIDQKYNDIKVFEFCSSQNIDPESHSVFLNLMARSKKDRDVVRIERVKEVSIFNEEKKTAELKKDFQYNKRTYIPIVVYFEDGQERTYLIKDSSYVTYKEKGNNLEHKVSIKILNSILIEKRTAGQHQ